MAREVYIKTILKFKENCLYRSVDFLFMRNIHLSVHPIMDLFSRLCCGEGVFEIKVNWGYLYYITVYILQCPFCHRSDKINEA